MRIWAIIITGLSMMFTTISTYAVPVEGEYYLGAYLGDQKIGYMVYKIEKLTAGESQQYRVSSIMQSQLKVLGTDLSQYVTTVVTADKDMNPLNQDFAMTSGGKTTTVRAEYHPDRVECTVSTDSGSSKKTVSIPKGVKLIVDTMYGVSPRQLTPGSTFEAYYFNPLTLAIDKVKVTFEKEEKINVDGVEYDTQVLTSSTDLGDMTLWQTADGNVIQIQAVMGIRMVAESKEKATAGMGGGAPQDFAALSSVKCDKPIPNARSLRSLNMILKGIDDKQFALSDSRQKIVLDITKKEATVKVNVPASGPNRTLKLPVNSPALKDFLASTPYIDSDNQSIKKQAQEIAGQEKNISAVCSKLRKWIYENMSSRADIGISRPASDVLSNRQGVCRDYAVLFAAMARSLGVPAKVVSGIVYSGDAFYYHAWVECWVGKWVPYDATLNSDFVDATHIKLAEGDATSMFSLSKVIGGLQANIISFTAK